MSNRSDTLRQRHWKRGVQKREVVDVEKAMLVASEKPPWRETDTVIRFAFETQHPSNEEGK